MIHFLSRAVAYLQKFTINPATGEHKFQSYSTGFFVRSSGSLFLVTNWHVVTGINPASPTCLMNSYESVPHYFKLNLYSKNDDGILEYSLPLYGPDMMPLWKEHRVGSGVDLVIYRIPAQLENSCKFMCVDIMPPNSDYSIKENVAKDVFVLGYPFSRAELHEAFGADAPDYIPLWKRGSIASEPDVLFGGRVLLIDSLSRAGMSGSPVFVAQDDKYMMSKNPHNLAVFKKFSEGELITDELLNNFNFEDTTSELIKNFQFLGVYSGTIGSTKLAEVALGKCWHANVLREIFSDPQKVVMVNHAPIFNEYYNKYFFKNSQ